MRTSKPISVTLGRKQASVDRRTASGEYANASEVIRHALDALDREDAAFEEFLRAKAAAALEDPRPSVSGEDVFRRLRQRHEDRLKATSRGS